MRGTWTKMDLAQGGVGLLCGGHYGVLRLIPCEAMLLRTLASPRGQAEQARGYQDERAGFRDVEEDVPSGADLIRTIRQPLG